MRNERGLVGRGTVTLMILVLLVGLAAIDGGSVMLANLQISDTADAAATAASESWVDAHNFRTAKQAAGVTYWSSADPDKAIADFVATIMGLVPSDPRAGPATELLKAHFSTAMQQQGASASNALKSTFVAACLAPSAVSIGL